MITHLESDILEREVKWALGNIRDPVKKIRDTKGTLWYCAHTKMGTIKDRNGMDLKKAEDIKKRWQKYTELYKKIFMTP